MKLAIIGSRQLNISDLSGYIPPQVTEIVSGGARGIDTRAKEYCNFENVSFKPSSKLLTKTPIYDIIYRV